jgi:hypothetical protein
MTMRPLRAPTRRTFTPGSAELGRFASIGPLIPKDGVWRGTHDLRLKATGDNFEDNTRHGPPG